MRLGFGLSFDLHARVGAGTSMRQRAPQKLGSGEAMAQALLQAGQRGVGVRVDGRHGLDCPAYLIRMYTGP